jgi:hypothetical protein
MNIAGKYFQKHLADKDFKQSYFEERVKLDIEYKLEELKRDIQTRKNTSEIIKKIDSIEQYVSSI